METRLETLTESAQFIAEHHPAAEPLAAFSALIGDQIHLDRECAVVIRVGDYTEDGSDGEVVVNAMPARTFLSSDGDAAEQLANVAMQARNDGEGHDLLQAAIGEAIDMLPERAPAPESAHDGAENIMDERGYQLMMLTLDLQAKLAAVKEVRAHYTKEVFRKQASVGRSPEQIARYLCLRDVDELADLLATNRRTFSDFA